MTVWTSALLICLVLVLFWALLVSTTRLQRLDRLHRRTDAARCGLEAALRRRADAALAVAGALPGPDGAALSAAVAATRVADRPGLAGSDREGAENDLGRALAGVDRSRLPAPLRAELGEAEQLLVLARSVHNDAVRDTLVLRSRRLVRWLHLAGTAPLPSYFEIAVAAPDVSTPAAGRDRRNPGPAAGLT